MGSPAREPGSSEPWPTRRQRPRPTPAPGATADRQRPRAPARAAANEPGRGPAHCVPRALPDRHRRRSRRSRSSPSASAIVFIGATSAALHLRRPSTLADPDRVTRLEHPPRLLRRTTWAQPRRQPAPEVPRTARRRRATTTTARDARARSAAACTGRATRSARRTGSTTSSTGRWSSCTAATAPGATAAGQQAFKDYFAVVPAEPDLQDPGRGPLAGDRPVRRDAPSLRGARLGPGLLPRQLGPGAGHPVLPDRSRSGSTRMAS